MTFGTFYDGVSFDLRQRDETALGTDNNSKPLPVAEAMRITREQIDNLLAQSPYSRDAVEIDYRVTSDTDTIILPDNVLVVYAIAYKDAPFKPINGPYDSNSPRYYRGNIIKGEFKAGDAYRFRVLLSSGEITGSDTVLQFPQQHIELLRKAVVIEAASIVGVEIGQLYLMRYQKLLDEWVGAQPIWFNAKAKPTGGRFGYTGK